MVPPSIIGIPIADPPTTPAGWSVFRANFSVPLQAPTTTNELTTDERAWCTSQILGRVRDMIVNSTEPYADKFSNQVAARIVDIAAVDPEAQELQAAKSTLQDAMCFVDGQLWGVGDPKGTPPPNYIPGMKSSISYNESEKAYRYPPGSSQYTGPYSSFTVLDSKGTNGPPEPYIEGTK